MWKTKLDHNQKSTFLLLILTVSSMLTLTHAEQPFTHSEHSPTDDPETLRTLPLCRGVIPDMSMLTQSTTEGAHDALGAVGGGDITLTYGASVPAESRSYTQSLFDLVYPEITRIYDDPSNTIAVTLSFDPGVYPWNFYDSSTNTITISQLPPSSGTSPTWDAIFTHELIHAFHDAIYLTGGSWAE